jgi:hypothetical protein
VRHCLQIHARHNVQPAAVRQQIFQEAAVGHSDASVWLASGRCRQLAADNHIGKTTCYDRLHEAIDLHAALAPELLAYISSFLTLEAWDVVLTGTPGGVGMSDGRFLEGGDIVTVSIQNIGTLTTTIREHT